MGRKLARYANKNNSANAIYAPDSLKYHSKRTNAHHDILYIYLHRTELQAKDVKPWMKSTQIRSHSRIAHGWQFRYLLWSWKWVQTISKAGQTRTTKFSISGFELVYIFRILADDNILQRKQLDYPHVFFYNIFFQLPGMDDFYRLFP